MKKRLSYLLFGTLSVILIFGILFSLGAYTRVYNTPIRKDRIHSGVYNQHIANLSEDLGGLITEHNTVSTDLDTAETNITSLQTSLATFKTYGYVNISLYDFREVDASGDVGDATADGGILRSDTTPVLKSHTSGGTYKASTIQWAASNSDAIATQKPLPVDLDTANDLTLQCRFGNDGNTDQTSPTVSFFVNEYIAGVDATTDSFNDTTADTIYSSYDFTLDAANLDATSDSVTVIITPGAHTTNALYLSSCRLTYTRSF